MSITDIDLCQLNEHELRQLNKAIVERLKFLHSAQALIQVAQFQKGDTVEFENQTGVIISGIVIRCNQKTLTIVCDETGSEWRVSPSFVRKISSTQESKPQQMVPVP